MKKNYIKTFYQPLAKTDGLQIVGVEALMRLQDEKGVVNELIMKQLHRRGIEFVIDD